LERCEASGGGSTLSGRLDRIAHRGAAAKRSGAHGIAVLACDAALRAGERPAHLVGHRRAAVVAAIRRPGRARRRPLPFLLVLFLLLFLFLFLFLLLFLF